MSGISVSKLLAEIYNKNPEKFEITLVRDKYVVDVTMFLSKEELSEMLDEKFKV
jgi:hypothetical protein